MRMKFHRLRVPGILTVFASFTGQSNQVLNQIPRLLSFGIALRKARELQIT
ncbi:hypothetical protein RchiOBHm_Chr6g0272691 [Rosa chinensis]|uniref:Uncharacterized protein n=1 Tax=Rosa chinensis TaxID=74649 RepID=A0A2P6PRB3_ROSCH|nr:hypothetical protein RchiOBHm_Chr6g0272691 [Rosa chinensis]